MNKFFEKVQEIFKIQLVKYVLSAITIIGVGFILFNVAFLFAWFVSLIVRIPLRMFLSGDIEMNYAWVPIFQHAVYLIIIFAISWFVLKSKKLPTLVKATFLTVPAMVTLVTIGIFFYQIPIIVIGLSALITLGTLYYLYLTKMPWQYWLAIIYVAILALCIVIFKIEI